MSAARDRLLAAIQHPDMRVIGETKSVVAGILAADPAFEEAANLGLAFADAESALPEGWNWQVRSSRMRDGVTVAEAWNISTDIHATGPTPTAALMALAQRLREAG